ncbi:MAG: gliding motility-associated C-terminal domain-containing protein, partial [Maribacter sp.]|nr:gliding motility-associated C-terminal domain-containing protein [Maribacter sp.]
NGTANFTAGSSNATITVNVNGDVTLEPTETFTVTLSNPSGGATLGTATAIGTITNDDVAPTPSASITASDGAAAENPLDVGTFTVNLSTTNITGGAIVVNYTIGGTATNTTDYATLSGTVSIPNNASSNTITVTPVNDALVEGTETVILTLSNGTGYTVGAPNNATVNIVSEDACPTTAPVLNTGIATVFCDSFSQNLNAYTSSTPLPGSVLTWSTNNNPLNIGAHLSSSIVSSADTYYGFFYNAANNCASAILTVTLTLNTSPTAGNPINGSACSIGGNNETRIDLDNSLSGNPDNGDWAYVSGPSLNSVSIDGQNRVQFLAQPPGNYVFSYTTNTAIAPCLNETVNVTISVTDCTLPCDAGNSAPVLNSDVPTVFCDAITTSLNDYTSSTPPSGTTLEWTTDSTNPTDTNSHLTPAEITDPLPGTYYAMFYDATNNCASPLMEVTLTLNTTPTITGATASPAEICGSGSITFSATGTENPNFNWYANIDDDVLLGTGSSFTTDVLESTDGNVVTYTFYVEATANGCTSVREPVTVTVYPVVTAGTATNTTACNNQTFIPRILDLDNRLTGASPGTWAFTSGPEILIPNADNLVDFNGSTEGDYVFTYTTTGAQGPCTNESASVTISVSSSVAGSDVDLEVTKTANTLNAQVGERVVFTVTVTNLTNIAVQGAKVGDLLESGFQYVSHASSIGTFDPVVGEWNIPAIDALGNATLEITVDVLAGGTYTNTATLLESIPLDSDTTNDTATVAINVGSPQEGVDLLLEKTALSLNPFVGDQVVFTIRVTNQSVITDAITNILVEDINLIAPSTGFNYISDTADMGTYDRDTAQWIIPSLAQGQVATLLITVQVPLEGVFSNTARILQSTPGDPITSNNEALVTISVRIPTPAASGFIFNEFSPNNDGTNDFLKIRDIATFPGATLTIFNRYGNLVLENKNMTQDEVWDGTWKNEDAPEGTYFYILDLADGSAVRKGWIQLIR